MTEKQNFTFPKKERLKGVKLIERLFKERNAVTSFPIKLFYIKVEPPTSTKIKAGVSVPKKSFKSAVKRNRIKRLLRESYRLNKHFVFNNSEGNFAFLILYLGSEMPNYKELEKNMQIVFKKFLKKIGDAQVE